MKNQNLKSNFSENVRFCRGEIGAIVVHLFQCFRFSPVRLEQVFDQYDIPEDPEKIFTNNFSIVGHEKMIIFGVSDDFISNFTYNDLY